MSRFVGKVTDEERTSYLVLCGRVCGSDPRKINAFVFVLCVTCFSNLVVGHTFAEHYKKPFVGLLEVMY